MELNCPQCAAHFNVPDGAIGPKGRKLKCAVCGHTWRQMPAEHDASQHATMPTADMEPSPPPAQDSTPLPMEMEPGEDTARPDQSMEPGGSVPMDSAEDATDDIDDPLAGLDFGDSLDVETDLDDLSDLGAADRALAGDTDLDDLLASDPEPIPEMFAREDIEGGGGKRKSRLPGVLLGLVILLAVVASGLYFGRASVVRALPETEAYYRQLGIAVDALGIGLRFNDVTSERLVREGTDTLVVRGFIANTTAMPRTLPFLRLALFDATDALIQDVVAEPPQVSLDPGATTGFRIQMENPSAAARRFEVDWTPPPTTEDTGH